MFIATNRSVLAVLVLASSALLGGATSEGPGNWNISFNPDPVTQGSAVTITVDKAPSFPVEIEFFVNGVSQGTGIIAAAGGNIDFPVPAGSSGQTWKADCYAGTNRITPQGVVAP